MCVCVCTLYITLLVMFACSFRSLVKHRMKTYLQKKITNIDLEYPLWKESHELCRNMDTASYRCIQLLLIDETFHSSITQRISHKGPVKIYQVHRPGFGKKFFAPLIFSEKKTLSPPFYFLPRQVSYKNHFMYLLFVSYANEHTSVI